MTDEGRERFPEETKTLDPGSRLEPKGGMRDWNVVISVRQGGFHRVRKLFREFGAVSKSGFRGVLVMQVDDPKRLLEALAERAAREPDALAFLGRAVPVCSTFTFQSPEEFEAKARGAALTFVPELAAKGFHVRMYRHGFKGRLSVRKQSASSAPCSRRRWRKPALLGTLPSRIRLSSSSWKRSATGPGCPFGLARNCGGTRSCGWTEHTSSYEGVKNLFVLSLSRRRIP